ncbi:hypothetical protein [Isoalcanivorax indicus]|uniref:hypothetical protein n=1 Tax=Isoalcanivorax indicus TaxID=2202653 RepID=UPI0013C45462|nr:hypothetical protein [Isoalcanivorax indicus]
MFRKPVQRRMIVVLLVVAVGVFMAARLLPRAVPPPVNPNAEAAQLSGQLAARTDPAMSGESVPLEVVARYEARQAFFTSLQAFLDDPSLVPPEQRAAYAATRMNALRDYAERGELSAAEVMLLQLALLRHQVEDAEYDAAATALIEDTAQVSAERERVWREEQAVQMAAYRERERAVIEEVEGMTSFPGGMTRGQYLRERLQAEREQLAAEEAPAPR